MHFSKKTLLILLFSISTPVLFAAETITYNRASYQVTEQQKVANDEITVTMGAERNDQDATRLANEINQLITSANATIKKFPMIKSSTSDYSIRPVYSRDKRLDHWRGASSITLKSQNIKDMVELVQILQKTLLIKSTRYNVSPERKEKIETGMQDFKGLPHRTEVLGKIGRVEFINDSKATNVNSTWYALESISNPVIWIAGGIDKGNDYSLLKDIDVASDIVAQAIIKQERILVVGDFDAPTMELLIAEIFGHEPPGPAPPAPCPSSAPTSFQRCAKRPVSS